MGNTETVTDDFADFTDINLDVRVACNSRPNGHMPSVMFKRGSGIYGINPCDDQERVMGVIEDGQISLYNPDTGELTEHLDYNLVGNRVVKGRF